jgi:hypothetical protein
MKAKWTPASLAVLAQKWNKSKTLLITTLAGCGLVLFIAAHGFLVAWGGIKLSDKIGGWVPWIAGGALIAFGLYHVIQQIRGKGRGHSHLFGGHVHDRGGVERGPRDGFLVNLGHGFVEITVFETDVPPRFRLFFYDQRKQARSVPAHATVKIETMRPDGARQTFGFHAKGEYLESTNDIPKPHKFNAIFQLSHGSHTHTHEVQFSEHDPAHGGCKQSEPATSGNSAVKYTCSMHPGVVKDAPGNCPKCGMKLVEKH